MADLIIELHKLSTATEEKDLALRIRYLADELSKIGNEQHDRALLLAGVKHHIDKGYVITTHEEQAEFTKKRNYNYRDIGDCV